MSLCHHGARIDSQAIPRTSVSSVGQEVSGALSVCVCVCVCVLVYACVGPGGCRVGVKIEAMWRQSTHPHVIPQYICVTHAPCLLLLMSATHW